MEVIQNADFRINEKSEILMIVEGVLFDYMQDFSLRLSGNTISAINSVQPLEIKVRNKELLIALKKTKKIMIAQRNMYGVFQTVDNIAFKNV